MPKMKGECFMNKQGFMGDFVHSDTDYNYACAIQLDTSKEWRPFVTAWKHTESINK